MDPAIATREKIELGNPSLLRLSSESTTSVTFPAGLYLRDSKPGAATGAAPISQAVGRPSRASYHEGSDVSS